MVKLENVSFSYQGQEQGCLHNIDMTVADGECVLLCGRSGCGKTTITRLVNGLIPNFYAGELTGSVIVNGQNIAELPMYKIAQHIGSVFQNPRTQFFNVDTDSEIAFGIENESLPPSQLVERVEHTTRELHIENLRGRNIFELSGGEKQKIAFASVYAMNPSVYLLDEPSSNLDMASIHELREHLRLIKAQGKTILIAEHRLFYLMDVVDRILYLEKGRIAGVYTPAQFCELSNTEREAMGLRATNLTREKLSNPQKTLSKPSLELKDVTLRHKKRVVLEHINLQAARGDVIAIVGHNGVGKTTFSRALCGLHKESTGDFLWDEVLQPPNDRLKRSYMVMQDVNYELFAESVQAECSFGIKNPNKELVRQTMDALGLTPFAEQHPNTLSGGQKQRVAVAASIVSNKELLVFDEPSSGLDYDSMVKVAAMLRELVSLGKIVFVVTHDYELVCKTCTRLICFDHQTVANDLVLSAGNESQIRALMDIPNEEQIV